MSRRGARRRGLSPRRGLGTSAVALATVRPSVRTTRRGQPTSRAGPEPRERRERAE